MARDKREQLNSSDTDSSGIDSTVTLPGEIWKDFKDPVVFDCKRGDRQTVLLDGEGRILHGVTDVKEEGCYEMVVYPITFNGRDVEKERVLIAATYAYPKNRTSYPAIVIFSEEENLQKQDIAAFFVSRGYGVMIVDFYGKTDREGHHTVYPDAISYANLSECDPDELAMKKYKTRGLPSKKEKKKKKDDVLDEIFGDAPEYKVKNTACYEWTAVGRCAVQFISTVKEVTSVGLLGSGFGGDIVWRLLSLPAVSCGVVLNSAGWRSYGTGDDNMAFWSGMDAQNYTMLATVPVFVAFSLRNVDCSIKNAYYTYRQIKNDKGNGFICTEERNVFYDVGVWESVFHFYNKYLRNVNSVIPGDVSLVLQQGERQSLKVAFVPLTQVDDSIFKDYEDYYDEEMSLPKEDLSSNNAEISNVDVYVANVKDHCATRFWKKCSLLDEDEWVFSVDNVESGNLCAYARVEFSNGLIKCSNPLEFYTDTVAENIQRGVLFDGEDSFDDFRSSVYGKDLIGGKFALRMRDLTMRDNKGVNGLYCEKGFYTNKIAATPYRAGEREELMFDILNLGESGICVSAYVYQDGAYERFDCENVIGARYAQEERLLPIATNDETDDAPSPSGDGESDDEETVNEEKPVELKTVTYVGWDTAVLSAESFINGDGRRLQSFVDCCVLQFESDDDFIVNNMSWT